MDKTLNDLAPYPQTAEDITAESLVRALAVRAYARAEWAKENVDDPFMHSIAAQSVQADYGFLVALRVLAAEDTELADTTALAVWRYWESGDAVQEALWFELRQRGVDPDQVAALAKAHKEANAA